MKKFLLTIILLSAFTNTASAKDPDTVKKCTDELYSLMPEECFYRDAYLAGDLKYCENVEDKKRCERAVRDSIADKQEKQYQVENYGQEVLKCIESKELGCLAKTIETAKNPDIAMCKLYDYVHENLLIECVYIISDYTNITTTSACQTLFTGNERLLQCVSQSKHSNIEDCDIFSDKPDKDGHIWKDTCISNIASKNSDSGICKYISTTEDQRSCRASIRYHLDNYNYQSAISFLLLMSILITFYSTRRKKKKDYKVLFYFLGIYLIVTQLVSITMLAEETIRSTLYDIFPWIYIFTRPYDIFVIHFENGFLPQDWMVSLIIDLIPIFIAFSVFKLANLKFTAKTASILAIIATLLATAITGVILIGLAGAG